MKNFVISFCILAFILSIEIPPCNAAGTPMDITEAIGITLKQNSGLRSLKQEAVKAEAFMLQAYGTLLPSINITAYTDLQKEKQTTGDPERYDNRVVKATLEQILYSGGKNSALQRQSAEVKTIAKMMIADGENSAIGELFARFYNVLLQEERIKAEESAIKTAEAHLREVTKMRDLGLANSLEVIRAGQLLATNNANLSTAQGLYHAAHISVMNYMGIPPEDRRPLAGTLDMLDAAGSRADSLLIATEHRADLHWLAEQLKYQKNQIEIERSAMRPEIAFGASAGYLNPYMKEDTVDDTWRAELSVSIPIFDRNITRSSVIKAGAKLAQDKISLEQKELDIKSEVETAWSEIESTGHHLNASSKALQLAIESLRLAEVGYREGVTPQLDLLTAQTSLTSARLDYARSQYNHLLTIVALRVTEGIVINWTKERKSQ